MNARADVIVAGAGIAGLALATALGRGGLRVLVLDPASRPELLPSGVGLADWDRRVSALTPLSQQFLTDLDAWPAMAAARTAPYERMSVWDAEGTGHIEFCAADSGLPALGHIVENRITVAALLEQAERQRAVSLCWQEGLDDISRDEEGLISVSTTAGQTISAPLLVGADGARSPVRDLAGLAVREWSYEQHAIVATVALAGDHAGCCYQAFLATGPLALLPLAEPGFCSIVWSLDDGHWEGLMALDDDGFVCALNRALAGDGPEVTAVGERAVFPLRQCHAIDYIQPRIALVADAAHSIHPLAGQGINLGLKDVAVLAAEILHAHECDLDWGELSVLRRYQRQRKTDNLALMAAMEAFKRGFGSVNPLLRVARNVGLSAVDGWGPIKQWLASRALG